MSIKEKTKIFIEHGVSIAYIAKLAGLNKATISRWLNGTRETVKEETEDRIENALAEIASTLFNTVNGITLEDEIVLDDDIDV